MNRWLRLKFNNKYSIFTVEPSLETTITMETTEIIISIGPHLCKDDENWCRYLSPWECDHNNIGTSCLQSCEKCGNVTRGNSMSISHI